MNTYIAQVNNETLVTQALEEASRNLKAQGLDGKDLAQALETLLDSKICDLDDTLSISTIKQLEKEGKETC